MKIVIVSFVRKFIDFNISNNNVYLRVRQFLTHVSILFCLIQYETSGLNKTLLQSFFFPFLFISGLWTPLPLSLMQKFNHTQNLSVHKKIIFNTGRQLTIESFFDSRVPYLWVTWLNVLCRYRVIRYINQSKARNNILLNLPVLRLFNFRIFPMFLNNMSKCLCCFINYNFYLLNSLLTQYLCSQCNMCILAITHYASCFPSQEAYHQYSNLV